jgi:hypothetical protein
LATSALGIPRSTASSTFTLRSFEYARMPNSFAEDQTSCKPLLQLDAIQGSGLTPRPFLVPGNGRSAAACPSTVYLSSQKAASR